MADNDYKLKIGIQDDTSEGLRRLKEKLSNSFENLFSSSGSGGGGGHYTQAVTGGSLPSGGSGGENKKVSEQTRKEDIEYKNRQEQRRESNEDLRKRKSAYDQFQAEARGSVGLGASITDGSISGVYSSATDAVSKGRDAFRHLRHGGGQYQAKSSSGMASGGGFGGGSGSAGFLGGGGGGSGKRQFVRIGRARINVGRATFSGRGMMGMHGGGGGTGAFAGRTAAGGGGGGQRISQGNASGMGQLGGAMRALPIAGMVLGAAIGAANSLANARLSYLSSQKGTMGAVGLASAGGTGVYSGSGLSAGEKGQHALSLQQNVSGDFTGGGAMGVEAAGRFGKGSLRFALGQGMGASGGAKLFGQTQQLGQYKTGGDVNNTLAAIVDAGMQSGRLGAKQRGQFAQSVLGMSEQAINSGASATGEQAMMGLSSTMASVMKAGGTFSQSQAITNKAQQDMSGGLKGGGILNKLAMLSYMQTDEGKAASPFEMLKFSQKGLTDETMGMLQNNELMQGEMGKMLMAFGGNYTARESELISGGLNGRIKGRDDKGTQLSKMGDFKDNLGGVEKSLYFREQMGASSTAAEALQLQQSIQTTLQGMLPVVQTGVDMLTGLRDGVEATVEGIQKVIKWFS